MVGKHIQSPVLGVTQQPIAVDVGSTTAAPRLEMVRMGMEKGNDRWQGGEK